MKNSEFDKFGEFIHGADSKEPLHSSRESLVRFENGIEAILTEAREILSHSWIAKAKSERDAFWGKVGGRQPTSIDSRAELLEALKSILGIPKLGIGIQMHFRNKNIDELTDAELASILEDEELLAVLEESFGKGKNNGPGKG